MTTFLLPKKEIQIEMILVRIIQDGIPARLEYHEKGG
jgi:hypothetical protein